MSDGPTNVIRLADLGASSPRSFLLEPDADARKAIAAELGIDAIRKLRFAGEVRPEGARDYILVATLGATVVQPCVVTLDPVSTRIDEKVTRRYLAELDMPEAAEVEMPEDDSAEPLPRTLDLAEVMTEALALSLPAFPRSEGAPALDDVAAAPPGVTPLTDEDTKPFAALKGLKDKLSGDD